MNRADVLAATPYSGITKDALKKKGALEEDIELLVRHGLIRYTNASSIPSFHTLVRVRQPGDLEIHITDRPSYSVPVTSPSKVMAPEVLYDGTVTPEGPVCYTGSRQEGTSDPIQRGPDSRISQRSKVMTATAEPTTENKTVQTNYCLFSGRPIPAKARFVPGYDAKMKSALMRRYREQEIPAMLLGQMSDEVRQRFEHGDLSNAEGAQAELENLGWGQYATAAPAKKSAKPKPAEYIGPDRSFEEVEYLSALVAQGGTASSEKKHTDYIDVHTDTIKSLALDGLIGHQEGVVTVTPLGMSALSQSAVADEEDENDEDEDDEE